jgi:hypothetical protein
MEEIRLFYAQSTQYVDRESSSGVAFGSEKGRRKRLPTSSYIAVNKRRRMFVRASYGINLEKPFIED